MTAISKAFVDAADTAVDPDSPLDAPLITGFRDSLRNLREWLGASYYAGAVQDHNHDGTNSAAVQIGANYLRNGSFENGVAGWSQTNYAGGAQAIDTTHALDGANCLAITSTVLANGGGYAQTTEYELVVAGRSYIVQGNLAASVANVSSKAEIIWFDKTKTQISISTLFSNTSTPTTATDQTGFVTAPANATYKQLRITGGVPGVGSATGTVYFDGLIASQISAQSIQASKMEPAQAAANYVVPAIEAQQSAVSTTSTSPVKVREWNVWRPGTYRILQSTGSPSGAWCNIQVYKNGVAYGALHQSNAVNNSFTDDLQFAAGDLVQIYIFTGSATVAVNGTGMLGELTPMVNRRTL